MTRPSKTFWWIRHAPTHAKTMVGWSDLPADLSDRARLDRLGALLPPDAPVVSSDLRRTRATADALASGRPRLPDRPTLRELHFGAWENRSFAEIEAEDPELIRNFWERPGGVTAPDGECWHDLRRRVDREVDALLGLPGADLIVVAHFGVILCQIERVLRLKTTEAFAQHVENLSLTRLRFDGTWHAELINHPP